MPIYEYDCLSCGDRFERLQRISDPEPEACPACGASAPRRRISESAFHLKGSGWYTTDYARKGKPAEGGAKGDSAKADSAKADSAPAPAAEKSGSGESSGGAKASAAGASGNGTAAA